MKKTLSIVLSVAMMMTCILSMFVMPASALNGYDFLLDGSISVSEGMTYEFDGETLVINATAAGQELALTVEGEANLNDYPFWEATIDAAIPYDVALYDPNNSKWMFAAGDFCYNFDPNNGAAQPIPASNQTVKFSLTGAYTWTGSPLPANAAVKSITFIAKAAGTITVTKCAMTDGISDVELFPENSWNDDWNAFNFLASSDRVNDWIPSSPDMGGNSEAIVSYDDDACQMTFGNTNGNWPSAYIEVGEKYDYASTAIDVNLSVLSGAQTTLYVFFGDATPDDFEGAGKAYGTILADVTAGNYSGYVMLSDILPADSDVIKNGKVEISYVKIFATSGAVVMDPAVCVNWIDICYAQEAAPVADLGDMDKDGDVDTYDALIIFNAAGGYIDLTDEEYACADMDMNGEVDTTDALLAFSEASGVAIEDLI